jgi:hypothetical protein
MAQAAASGVENNRATLVDLASEGTDSISTRNLVATDLLGFARDFRSGRSDFERIVERALTDFDENRANARTVVDAHDVLMDVHEDSDDLSLISENLQSAISYVGRVYESADAARALAGYARTRLGIYLLVYEAGLGPEEILTLINDLEAFARTLDQTVEALYELERNVTRAIRSNDRFVSRFGRVEQAYEFQVIRRSKLIGINGALDVIREFGPIPSTDVALIASFAARSFRGWANWASGYFLTNVTDEAFRFELISSGMSQELAQRIYFELQEAHR